MADPEVPQTSAQADAAAWKGAILDFAHGATADAIANTAEPNTAGKK